MSQLSPFLRQIAKKSSHPNTLIYTFQRERAGRLFERGELEGGAEAVALAAPVRESVGNEGLERGVDDAVRGKDGVVRGEGSGGVEGVKIDSAELGRDEADEGKVAGAKVAEGVKVERGDEKRSDGVRCEWNEDGTEGEQWRLKNLGASENEGKEIG